EGSEAEATESEAAEAEAAEAEAAEAEAAAGGRLAVYPNPSGGRSTVGFTLDAPAAVRLSVLDELGREVAVLVEGALPAGGHAYPFVGADLPAGLYLARLEVGGRVETHRFSVVR
ncbi:MAG TPA: T9SS type A sorting domain-containing protein, partial [Rubricoccaceae bacterium]|nr:T9SS type A sorting domain-containing protein [Rubricoccaceae bacterium]